MQLKTIKKDLPYLRQKSKKVNFDESDLYDNIDKVKEYTMTHDVWAMASIQLGIPMQIIYVKSFDPRQPGETDQQSLVLINPRIISKKGKTQYWEACASCMPYIGLVERPYEIKVEFQDLKGNKKLQTFVGFESTVISHELDHLNGVLHMDRAIKLKQLNKEQRIQLRKSEPYKVLSTDCEFEYSSPSVM